MDEDGYINGIQSAVKFSFFAKFHVHSSPSSKWGQIISSDRKKHLSKVTWMEKLILTFLSRKLKLKKLLKYLKVKKVPARNFECGECLLKLLNILIEKSRRKALRREENRKHKNDEKTFFLTCRNASELIKMFSWKLETAPEIPGMFPIASFLYCLLRFSLHMFKPGKIY